MKTLQKLGIVFLFLATFSIFNAQNTKTETAKVFGNCGMCKSRIEKAAKEIPSVTANWDKKTKILSFTYDPNKTSRAEILKKIAAAGHDNELYLAKDEDYDDLPGCCQYERKENQKN